MPKCSKCHVMVSVTTFGEGICVNCVYEAARHAADAEVVTNEAGGQQSHVAARYDLLPHKALKEEAIVLGEGAAKYGVDNWRLISKEDHINHAIAHLFLALAGDTSENHLANAACRVHFANDELTPPE